MRKPFSIMVIAAALVLLSSSLSFSTLIQQMAAQATTPKKLLVSDNGHFLVQEDGTPFVWTGDTIWRWPQLSPSQWDTILADRHNKGFNVIQVHLGPPNRRNYKGNYAYSGSDRADLSQPNLAWWSEADNFIRKAKDYGIYIAIVPLWGGAAIHHGYTEKQLRNFGRWLGDRYRNDDNIIWLTVGEATLQSSPLPISKVRALADGIREGDTGNKLLTVHMGTGRGLHALHSYGTALAGYDFVDFNSWQTGQECCRSLPGGSTHWGIIENDWKRISTKPTAILEAFYENHPGTAGQPKATSWDV